MTRQAKSASEKRNTRSEYIFRLYITGASPNSLRAISNTRSICDQCFTRNYDLEIIDVYKEPLLAAEENIIALPLLIRKFPLPEKRWIGDMSDQGRVLQSIRLENPDS
ncbi:MAG TPA: circadian clock KaiB family protein [Chitinophagaceae bacterium]|jgi:circadian clock protein KaiB